VTARQKFTAAVEGLEPRTTSAWNSAIRASEAAVREVAREEGQHYIATDPVVTREGGLAVYTRTWTSNSCTRVARVSGPADRLRIPSLKAASGDTCLGCGKPVADHTPGEARNRVCLTTESEKAR
jgi:hypothetical protein